MRKIFQLGIILFAASVLLLGQRDTFVRGAQVAPIQCEDMEDNIREVAANCATINGKHICYSSDVVIGLPFTPHFSTPNDRVSLRVFDEVFTLDTAGIAIVNLAEVDAEEALFGTLIGPVAAELAESEILCLRARQDVPACENAPPGLVVRSSRGTSGAVDIGPTNVVVTGTAYIAANISGDLRVVNLNGDVRVTTAQYTVSIPENFEANGIEGACRGALSTGIVDPPSVERSPLPPEVLPPSLAEPTPSPAEPMPDTTPTPAATPTALPPTCNQTIEIGETIDTQNYAPGQVCLISFCTSADETVTIEMTALDGNLDPWLELRDPDDRTIKYNDDISQNNRNSLICHQPLPVDGCYTIAARSYGYESFGPFQLSLGGRDSECEMPEMRCDVIARRGLNLRAGPSVDAPIINTLPRGAFLEPLARDNSGEWVQVITRSGETGWVSSAEELLMCDDLEWVPTSEPTPTSPPPTLPPPPSDPDPTPTPRKPGQFSAP